MALKMCQIIRGRMKGPPQSSTLIEDQKGVASATAAAAQAHTKVLRQAAHGRVELLMLHIFFSNFRGHISTRTSVKILQPYIITLF